MLALINSDTGVVEALVPLVIGVAVLYLAIRLMAGAVRRQRTRECPACGALVRRGRTTCDTCDHDFAAAAGR